MWVNVQAIDVKFAHDFAHQKSIKSVNFWQSYLKNKKVDVFLGHSVFHLPWQTGSNAQQTGKDRKKNSNINKKTTELNTKFNYRIPKLPAYETVQKLAILKEICTVFQQDYGEHV